MNRFLSKAALGLTAFFTLAIGATAPASAAAWQCVTYARSVSDIEIRGNAHTWWASAEGVYARGAAPAAGAVMVLRPHGRMRLGHVAMVREIVDSRHVRLNHANWSRRGMVESNVLAEDVSPNNDWSLVKIWHSPTGQLGLTEYPVYGFIYPENAEPELPRVQIAAADIDQPARTSARARGGNQSDSIGDLIASLD